MARQKIVEPNKAIVNTAGRILNPTVEIIITINGQGITGVCTPVGADLEVTPEVDKAFPQFAAVITQILGCIQDFQADTPVGEPN